MNASPKQELEFPRVRAAHRCPVCGDEKPSGCLLCWPCQSRMDRPRRPGAGSGAKFFWKAIVADEYARGREGR
jgi:hypothetical protein